MAQYGYGYLDMGDGLALVQVQPGQKTGYVFYDGSTIKLRGHKLSAVPRGYLARHRAPTVIWKPDASPDVTNSVDVEMVDLAGPTDCWPGAPGMGAPAGGSIAPAMAVAALALVGGVGVALWKSGAFA